MSRRWMTLLSVGGAMVLALSMALPASAAATRFGAKLTKSTQPHPAMWCDDPNEEPPHANCTWILTEALQRPNGGQKAPKAGTIGKVRLVSCGPGAFKVQVARRVSGTQKYRVVRDGPRIQYQGDVQGCGDEDDLEYRVESFSTNFRVNKGDMIAIKAKRAGTIQCSGANLPVFAPPLVAGGNARKPTNSQGCYLLVEWQYK
ncbi:hypothetical protein BH23CHL8_BH23CHL8_00620 [soil metagenome]